MIAMRHGEERFERGGLTHMSAEFRGTEEARHQRGNTIYYRIRRARLRSSYETLNLGSYTDI